VRTGYVPTELLPTLVAGARAFCLPSLFEGFGMPVPEAMATGVPTVASDDDSIDEACGHAALRVVARDVEAMAEALETAVYDPAERARLIAAGHAHVAGLTWDACARAIADGLEAAAAGSLAPVAVGSPGATGSAYFRDHADPGDRA
jgi:alpha-1,3-rhamnosyl/mannosyltransferase